MLRLKIFSSATHGGDIKSLSDDINGWLASEYPAIRQMAQSSAAEQVVVTFLYESEQHQAHMRMASAAVPEVFTRGLNASELDPADDEPTILPDAELPY